MVVVNVLICNNYIFFKEDNVDDNLHLDAWVWNRITDDLSMIVDRMVRKSMLLFVMVEDAWQCNRVANNIVCQW